MLSLVEEGRAGGREGTVHHRLDDLTEALGRELRHIDDLKQALLRQRAAVAADDPEAIESSVHAIGRTLLTLEEARRKRSALIALMAGDGAVALSDLDAHLGFSPPESFVAAREAVRRAAEATSRELAINQTILRRALEAGDAFLQQLFSSTADPMPSYTPGPRAADPRPGGFLLNRTA
jgi:hypothetical protein